jgi:hypothetical protein
MSAAEQRSHSELDDPVWSVISNKGVEHHAVPYAHARRMIEHHESVGDHGLAIVTASAAKKLIEQGAG